MKPEPASIADLLARAGVILCVGAGGVGKTTVSAALAVAAAKQGRKVALVTIDPARRLADAMGLDGLSNTPHRVTGDWDGELWAMMLDAKATFDEMVDRHATDADQAERILNNRYYRNIVSALSGNTEFMAAEKLYELHESGYDLIVVDTPPSSNSLEFVTRPDRLHHFVTKRLKWIIRPPGPLRAVSKSITLFLRQAARVVGQQVVEDSLAFLQAFDGMEEGFGNRARLVGELLKSDDASFVLVSSARPEPAREAARLGQILTDAGHGVDSLIINRLAPDLDVASSDVDPTLSASHQALVEHQQVVEAEHAEAAALASELDVSVIHRLERLEVPIADLAGISQLAATMAPA